MARELGFSKMWDKLDNDLFFTTFRFARKDAGKGRDWKAEEVVKIVYKPRSPKDRKFLGMARIIKKELKDLNKRWLFMPGIAQNMPDMISPQEAHDDGFYSQHGGGDVEKMIQFFRETSDYDTFHHTPIYKLTLYWISKESDVKKETAILVPQTPEPGGAHPVPVQGTPALTGNTPSSGPVPGGMADSAP